MYQIVSSNTKEVCGWLKATIPSLKPNREYCYTIKEYRGKRSLGQNSLYFMWLAAIANFTGNDKNDIHEAYCRKFLKWEETMLPGGLSYWDRCHTPHADTAEFSQYLEKIHLHAYEFLDFWLPYPDDKHFQTFVEQYKYISKGMEIEYS